MEINKIIEKIKKKEEKIQEYFFAIQIEEGTVKGAAWSVQAGEVVVAAVSRPQSYVQVDELVGVVDAALSEASERAGLPSSLTKSARVIFGLPHHWVEDEKVASDKLALLKTFSKKLDLKPLGFVLVNEAVAYYLKLTEGIPPTVILLGVRPKKLDVSLLNLGKVLGATQVQRSEDVAADLEEGLLRLQTEGSFPARILLFDSGSDLEKLRTQLVDHSWSEGKITFLHLPKVEILAQDYDIRALSLAGGREAVQAVGMQAAVIKPALPSARPTELLVDESQDEEAAVEDAFGFVQGEDIAEQSGGSPSTPVGPPLSKTIGSEVSQSPVATAPSMVPIGSEEAEMVTQTATKSKKLKWKFNFQERLSSLKRTLMQLRPKGKRTGFKLSQNQSSKLALSKLIWFAVIPLVLMGAGFAFYHFFPRAEIILRVQPKLLEKSFSLAVGDKNPDQKGTLFLKGEGLEAVVEGSGQLGTTGTKLIGQEAKGEVEIFNATSQEKIFPAGTVIESLSGLEFVFDDEVRVASQSGSASSATPGKSLADVTAVEIGAEGNLAAGVRFTVGNYSSDDIEAKSREAFSGGVSREVQVVSAEDQAGLLERVTDELKEKALPALVGGLSGGLQIIEDSLSAQVDEKNFSAAVGDEAVELSLNLRLAVGAIAYNELEMKSLIGDSVQDLIPTGYLYRSEESELNFSLQEMEGKTAFFEVGFSAKLVPEIDEERIKENLAGKRLPIAKAYLSGFPTIDTYNILLRPQLPVRLQVIPRVVKHISISVRVE